MKIKYKKHPTIGAVVLYYIFAIVLLLLNIPSLSFYFNKVETVGIISSINSEVATVNFSDSMGEAYYSKIKRENNNQYAIGDKVKVYYRKNKPRDAEVPRIQGNKPHVLSVLLVFIGFYAAISMHRSFLLK